MRYLFWRGSRGVRVGRRDGASRGVPGAVGGVDFGRVRGGAVRADDGGRRDRICFLAHHYCTKYIILFISPRLFSYPIVRLI